MAALYEAYRPRTLAEIVGQDRAVSQAKRVLARSWGSRAWWVTGSSGTGKTTMAYAIAAEGADEFFVEELDASTLTLAAVRELELSMRYTALASKPGRAYIVNEAHGLRKDTIRLLLVLLERLPEHVCMIFTTTKEGQEHLFDMDDAGDAAPLISRCIELTLENGTDTQAAFARRAKAIAQQEGIDGLPDVVYQRAIEACKGNMRALLQKIESGKFRDDARVALQREYNGLPKDEYAHNAGELAKLRARRAELAALLATL